MKKKLFITDLDGTLLNKAGSLDAELVIRLNRLIRNGEQITFVTGRDLSDTLTILKEVQVEIPCAVYNGSAICNLHNKEVLHYWRLSSEQIKELNDDLTKSDNTNITFVRDGQIIKEKFRAEIIDSYPVLSISLRDKKRIVNMIYERIAYMPDSSGMTIRKYVDPADDTVYIIDITSICGNKGSAARYIADYLGIGTKDIVAFGNDSNDIPLSRISGQFFFVEDSNVKLFENMKERIPFNEGFSVVDCIEEMISSDIQMPRKIRIPKRGCENEKVLSYLNPGKSSRAPGGRFMGYPQTTPHPMALKAYEKYLPYNTNQVGVFSDIHNLGSKTRKMEYEVLHMLGELYGIDEPDGYLTSGGTEGNIVGIWCGRNLLSKSVDKLYIVKTQLTHSSVSKAINIMNLPEINIAYDERFVMDLKDLRNKLMNVSSSDTGFIVVTTMGYTNTGTCDDILAVSDILTQIENLCGAKSYIHIDAAIGGMVYPFIDQHNINFFGKKNVCSITIDPHKMGYQPFSCGVFLGRKNLLLNIETECTYSRKHRELTLIGSRNGAAAAACWSTLMSMGVDGLRKTLTDLIEHKNNILQQLECENLIRIISNPPSNMCTIQFIQCSEKRLPPELEEKYATYAFLLRVDGVEQYCYKIYIMPHLEDDIINEFIEDIKRMNENE